MITSLRLEDLPVIGDTVQLAPFDLPVVLTAVSWEDGDMIVSYHYVGARKNFRFIRVRSVHVPAIRILERATR